MEKEKITEKYFEDKLMEKEKLTEKYFEDKLMESPEYVSAVKLADELVLAGVIVPDYMYTSKRANSQLVIIIQKALDKIS